MNLRYHHLVINISEASFISTANILEVDNPINNIDGQKDERNITLKPAIVVDDANVVDSIDGDDDGDDDGEDYRRPVFSIGTLVGGRLRLDDKASMELGSARGDFVIWNGRR